MRFAARLYLCLLGLSWKYGTLAHIDAQWNAYPGRQVPRLWPEGGRFTTPVAVTVDCPHADSTVHYVTCYEHNMTMGGGSSLTKGYYLSDEDCEFPTTVAEVTKNIDGVRWPPVPSGKSLLIEEKDHVLKARCVRKGGQEFDGMPVTAQYEVASGRYGYGYFVPYYNDNEGFSGKLARLDLRSHGKPPDFSNFQTWQGQGAYDGQLRVLDLAALDPDLKGFMGGFAAVSEDPAGSKKFSNFAYLVPHFNGRPFGKLVRVNLDYFTLCGDSTQLNNDPFDQFTPIFDIKRGQWNNNRTLNADRVADWKSVPNYIETQVEPRQLFRYYTDPSRNRGGANISSTACGVQVIDLETEVDPELRGFAGGFSAYHATYMDASLDGDLPWYEGCNCKDLPLFPNQTSTCTMRDDENHPKVDPFAFMPQLCPFVEAVVSICKEKSGHLSAEPDVAGWCRQPLNENERVPRAELMMVRKLCDVYPDATACKPPVDPASGMSLRQRVEMPQCQNFSDYCIKGVSGMEEECYKVAQTKKLNASGVFQTFDCCEQTWAYSLSALCRQPGMESMPACTDQCVRDTCHCRHLQRESGAPRTGCTLRTGGDPPNVIAQNICSDPTVAAIAPPQCANVAAATSFTVQALCERFPSVTHCMPDAGVCFRDGNAQKVTPAAHYGYLVPHHNGVEATSKVVRFKLTQFNASAMEVLDLAQVDNELRGFHGGFAYSHYAYLVPYRNGFGPVGGVNSQEPVDANQRTTQYHGKLVRIDMRDFSTSGVTVLDLAGTVNDDLRGFINGFIAGRFAYLAPYTNRNSALQNQHFGKIVRVDLDLFSKEGVQVLDLQKIDPDLAGFNGGFASGKYGYLTPFNNGNENFRNQKFFGKVVRLDLDDFSVNGVRIFDLPTREREQLPPGPDHNLRGFTGAFAAGSFGYFVPHFNGQFFGKVVRLDLVTHAVQFIDMRLDDKGLSGFSTGFTHRDRRICCNAGIGHLSKNDAGGCQQLGMDENNCPQADGQQALAASSVVTTNSTNSTNATNTTAAAAADTSDCNTKGGEFIKPAAQKFCGSRELRYERFDQNSGARSATETAAAELEPAIFDGQDENQAQKRWLPRPPSLLLGVMEYKEWHRLRRARDERWEARRGMLQVKYSCAGNVTDPDCQPVDGASKLWEVAYARLKKHLGQELVDERWNDVMREVEVADMGRVDCCAFIDQHSVEYVLWDRRAYTRGQRLTKTERDVTPPDCLYEMCEQVPGFK